MKKDQTVVDDSRDETVNERADRNWNEILQELRVSQTGTQIISGFLLAVAFQPRFNDLDQYQLVLYLTLVVLAGTAAALGLAPVSLHRWYFARHRKPEIVKIGDRLLVAALAVVALLTIGVTSLIFDFILGRTAGFIAMGLGTVVLSVLWLIIPRSAEKVT